MKNSRLNIAFLMRTVLVCAVFGLGMLTFGLLRTSIPQLMRMFTGAVPFELTHDAVIFAAAMLSLFLALVPLGVLLWYLRVQVMRPMLQAERYLEELSRGGTPPPLPTLRVTDRRVQSLFSALNLLRDRLRSLNARLENGLAREAELRRELEKYDRMQITLMARLLPETRRSLGVIKGLLIGEGGESDGDERGKLNRQALHRTAALSREIEQLIDISRLGLARWNEPDDEPFLLAVFMRELVNRSKLHFEARNISFESGFSGRPPARLRLDRELLYQLLSIMIRAVGRLSVSGSSIKFTCRGDGHSVEFEAACPVSKRIGDDFAASFAEAAESGFTADNIPIEILALGVVHDIAERIGCSLAVRKAGDGADFVMKLLPEHCLFDSGKLEFASVVEAVPDCAAVRRPSRTASGERRRRVLMWSDDADEAQAVTVVLGQSGILVERQPDRAGLERELLNGSCDGVILSTGAFDTDPNEIVFHLRKISGRPNLAVTVIASQMSDEIFRRLAELDRVTVLIMPINYAMLAAAFGA